MDRAVLDAYGWGEVRYTWDDDTRDEVLARLLEENRRAAAAAT
jgi:hypothetical protein